MSRYLILFGLLLPAVLIGQQLTFATYQGGLDDESSAGIARDSLGNLYVAGTTFSHDFPSVGTGGGFIVKLDSTGHRIASGLIPASTIRAIAVDSANTVIVAGTNNASGQGFVSKLNSSLQPTTTVALRATPTALAIDTTGIYVAGSAASGLNTGTGVFQPANKGAANAFVVKFAPDLLSQVYATYLGGSGTDGANAIAVDSTGDVYLTGFTTSSDFPLSNAAQTTFGGVTGSVLYGVYGDAFVAKLDPKGANLLYSTYLGGVSADEANAIAVDANGNAYVAGGTESPTWLIGPASGTVQTTYGGPPPDPQNAYAGGDAFLAKFSPAGALSWYTYLGGPDYDEAFALALDSSGNIYLSGNAGMNFPVAGNPVHDCHIGGHPFLAEFNPAGTKLLFTTGLPGIAYDQVYGMSLDALHNMVYLAGDVESHVFFATPGAAQTTYGGGFTDSFVVALNLAAPASFQVSCVLNGASFLAGNSGPFPTGAVAPGEIVSLFGTGLGPTSPALLQLTSTGMVSTTLGGMDVLFDGIRAPMLYASNGQINAVVPYGINPSVTNMTVERTGQTSVGPIPMPVVAAVPGVFMCGIACNDVSQAAVVNSDFTYNTVSNPAKRGDYVSLYLAGAGLMSDTVDGDVTPLFGPYPSATQQVTVTIRGSQATVQYYGAAPAYVNGLMQINVYIPTDIDFGNHVPVTVKVGNFTSQANVTIAVK